MLDLLLEAIDKLEKDHEFQLSRDMFSEGIGRGTPNAYRTSDSCLPAAPCRWRGWFLLTLLGQLIDLEATARTVPAQSTTAQER